MALAAATFGPKTSIEWLTLAAEALRSLKLGRDNMKLYVDSMVRAGNTLL